MRPLSLLLAAALSYWPGHSSGSSADTASTRQPVIVELFTSEGCSSCPPADSNLARLSSTQALNGIEVIALEEHVDYWNSQGWSDPFSSPDFSHRQEDYATVIHGGGIYTPQMIVDGRTQLIGSRAQEAHDQIRWAAASHHPRLLVTPVPSPKAQTRTFELRLDPATPSSTLSPLELWIAVTEKNLHSDVTGGENSGHTLQHAPVVRLLRKQHTLSLPLTAPVTFTVDLNRSWLPDNLTVVAFLSQPKSHQVEASGSVSLSQSM
jgi:hypothetical protein